MVSIKVIFRQSSKSARNGRIYYQVSHDGKSRWIKSEYNILSNEWDSHHNAIVDSSTEREDYIRLVRKGVREDVRRLSRIIDRLESRGISFMAREVVELYKQYMTDYSLFNYMEKSITRLKGSGKIRTSETYQSTLRSFKRFRSGEDIMIDNLTPEIMEAYQSWLTVQGISQNTISFYARILRAVYNRATCDGGIENVHPFKRIYTGISKTVKRALPIQTISTIRSLDLSSMPSVDFARDMFMLSFMLRGMSFVDMAFLKKTDIIDGHIHYRRRKTGTLLTIEWTEGMQRILDKYPENESDYLLPIIKKKGLNERCCYHNVSYNINHNLKTIAEMLHLSIPLTLYVARHSWASAALSNGIPISLISQCMGHSSETITKIYLTELDTTTVDNANLIVLKSLGD